MALLLVLTAILIWGISGLRTKRKQWYSAALRTRRPNAQGELTASEIALIRRSETALRWSGLIPSNEQDWAIASLAEETYREIFRIFAVPV